MSVSESFVGDIGSRSTETIKKLVVHGTEILIANKRDLAREQFLLAAPGFLIYTGNPEYAGRLIVDVFFGCADGVYRSVASFSFEGVEGRFPLDFSLSVYSHEEPSLQREQLARFLKAIEFFCFHQRGGISVDHIPLSPFKSNT